MDEIKIPIPIMMDITELKKHKLNVKEHPEAQINNLMNLIKMVGFKDPIVIDRDNIIWAGHGRLEAAFRLTMAQVPIIYLEDLSESQKKLFMYMDNQINESPWVMENVKILLGDVPQIELEQFQVDFNDILDITIEEEQDIPEVPAEPKSKRGEIYQLGDHRIMCGDSTNSEDIMKLCNSKCTIGFTSPPYNLGKNSKVTNPDEESKYIEYNDDNPEYLKLLINFTDWALRLNQFVFVNIQQLSGNKIQFIEYLYHFKNNFVDSIIWDKKSSAPALAKNVLNSEFEFILIFSPKNNPPRTINTRPFHGTIQNIYHAPLNSHNEFADIHRAVFPLHLPQFIINNFSKKNDIILDSFLGTGTTLIAAEHSNRICFGMELDPAYIDVVIERWENFTGKKAILVETCD